MVGFVFVLGMHRSGTSCLAGCLERCGVHLGEVSRKNKHNLKGNHELTVARQLNDRIFEAGGRSWDDPPEQPQVSDADRAEMKAIIGELSASAPAGLKDPRVTLLLEPWIEAAGKATFVGSFRHPEAVAQSLDRRNGLLPGRSYALWRRYNAEMIRLHKVAPFPLVEFDLSDAERYCADVEALAEQLGLTPDRAALRDFVTSKLDHARLDDRGVPDECRGLYDYLLQNRFRP